MQLGDKVTIAVGHETIPVLIDDRVYYDPTYGQYDSGWIVFAEDNREWFLSESGDVWTYSDDESHSERVGVCVEMRPGEC